MVVLEPIGVVRSPMAEPGRHRWGEVVSTIEVREEFREALEGLEEFSHILVLFHFHRGEPYTAPKVHPQRREDLPLVGVFATRTRARPNPIGLTACRLLKREGARLTVQGLDAIDGTPVLDIKPYIPGDCIPEATYPQWALLLHQEGRW